jgi:hypothetical protein
MADAVKTKLQKLSGQYSAKVEEKRKLEASKRKPFVTDAEVKTINEKIRKVESEYKALNKEYNELAALEKTAKEYSTLNRKLVDLNESLTRAENRGEDTISIKRDINKATSRLGVISPEVEKNFPELKKTTRTTVETKPISGPDAARLGGTKTPVTTPDVEDKPDTPLKKKVIKDKTEDNKVVDSSTAFPQYSGVDTTTAAGIAAASARPVLAADGTTAGADLDTLLAKTEFWYDLPDYIFKVDDKIGKVLLEAVNNDWSKEKFMAKVQLTSWWQKNAPTIRTKIIEREKYNDLRKAGEDVSKTEYGIYLGKQMRAVKAKAQELANVALTDEQAQGIAQKIYDGNLEDDPLAINSLIIPFIGKTTSIVGAGTGQKGFGGQALKDYQTLQSIARGNGFKITDILPNISALTAGGDLETAVLRGLADGTIDINRIAQDARMLAAQGQPEYVRGLLGQGYDLQDIYAPYRNTMAKELELNADQIDLNDPTLRMAITDKGDMNIYDFKKALRQDNRWQYTYGANEEVSNSVLGVLKDFGFQG